MAISALAKSGANLVERFDTSVSELELKYANNKLITDGQVTPGAPTDYRKITAGQVPGSDFYLVGGITELNFNIRSSGADVAGSQGTNGHFSGIGTGQLFIMNIGLDLRLVDTRTLQGGTSSPIRSRSSAVRSGSACSTHWAGMSSTSPPAKAGWSRSSWRSAR